MTVLESWPFVHPRETGCSPVPTSIGAMSVLMWLLVVLVVWSLVACVVGLVLGGAARLRDVNF